jgi:hypothetical protein
MKSYNLIKMLDSVRQRPGMYIGEPTLEKLSSFVYGYKQAMYEQGIEESPKIDFTEFSNWVRKKHGYPGSAVSAGWDKTIFAISMGVSPKDLDWVHLPKANVDEHHKSIELFIGLIKQYAVESNT